MSALVVGLMAPALPVGAAELEPYLERSGAAEFSGEQVISCNTPDGARDMVVDMSQTAGMLSVRSGSGSAVAAGDGVLSVTGNDGSSQGATVGETMAVPAGRYQALPTGPVEMLGRRAEQISITDAAGLERARMTFDLDTGALLSSEILNSDGSVYCESQMVSFSPGGLSSAAALGPDPTRTLEAAEKVDVAITPDQLGGFVRLDSYAWGREGVLAYYSDGLFSFTLLHTRRPVELQTDGAVTVAGADGAYLRWYGPGQALYVWESAAGSLALFGDMPLDLQEAVLAALPQPADTGVLIRWWRSVFG